MCKGSERQSSGSHPVLLSECDDAMQICAALDSLLGERVGKVARHRIHLEGEPRCVASELRCEQTRGKTQLTKQPLLQPRTSAAN